MIEFKKIEENDLPLIFKWFNQYEGFTNPDRDMLPGNGLDGFLAVKDGVPVASAHLYMSNSSVCYVEWIVADKEYREEDREDILHSLINFVSEEGKRLGFKYAMCFAGREELINAYKGAGFGVYNPPVTELIKKL